MNGPLDVLVLSPAPPHPFLNGTSLRVYHLLRHLGPRHRFTVAYQRHPGFEPVALTGVRTVGCDPATAPTRGRLTRLKESLLTGWPYPHSASQQQAVHRLLATERFDVVLAVTPSSLRYAFGPRGVPVVADLIDEPVLGGWRDLRLTRGALTRLRRCKQIAELVRYERHYCPRASVCVLAGQDDADSLHRLVPSAAVQLISNGVDLDYFQPSGQPPEPGSLLFSGHLAHPPNVAAVLGFHRTAFPSIKEACPDVLWYVVGANPVPEVRALAADPRVVVSGAVEDVRPYFERATVAIAPLRSGGGIKNKVLEAWAMGKAVVATPLGCAGLRAQDGVNVCIAETPGAFASATVHLLRDPARRAALGQAGRETARRHYAWEVQAARLETLLRAAARPA